MRVVVDVPPIFDEIDAVFGVRGKAILFAWGDTIFNPAGAEISPALLAHEAVHGERQGRDVIGWWKRYIAEPEFRLAEEIPAHRAEFQWHCRQPGADKPVPGFRSRKSFYESAIARRLAGPLYGNMITPAQARTFILKAAA